MKVTSTQQNNEATRYDQLHGYYVQEFRYRAEDYLNTLSIVPELSELHAMFLGPDFLSRLYFSPNIKTILNSDTWKEDLVNLMENGWNLIQREHIVEMIEDIGLAAKLRDPELFDSRAKVIMEHMAITNQEVLDTIGVTDIVTLYYLRRIAIVSNPKGIGREERQA